MVHTNDMTPYLAFDAQEMIQKMSAATGIEASLIHEKMNEKIQKFSGLLTEQGALVLLNKELGAKIPLFEKTNPKLTLNQLQAGMNNVDVEVHVSRMDGIKSFSKNGKEGKYVSIRLTDETGDALFTFWNEQADEALQKGIGVGSTLILSNARVGTFNGQTQLSLGYNGTYTVSGTPTVNTPEEKKSAVRLLDLTENALFEGNVHIVDVLPGKGYYVRCLACNGKLQVRETVCPLCKVEGKIETRLLVPLLVDDGSHTMRAVAFEKEAILLYGKSKEDVLHGLENGKQALNMELVGKVVQISARTKTGMDRTSLELIVQRANVVSFQNA